MALGIPAIPFVTGTLPAVGGTIRACPEDFRVEEIPAYLPCGSGDHLYLKVEKRLLSTRDVATALAGAAKVPPREVGFAGQKDRDAVTVQYFSVPVTGAGGIENIDLEGARVLSRDRHTNRLKTGHVLGNRFRIVLSGVGPGALEAARDIVASINAHGIPNAFGPQRFGREGQTASDGLRLIADPRRGPGARDRYRRKLNISAAQALLYNHYLAERAGDDLLRVMLAGDVAKKTETGGMFVVDDVSEAQARLEAREIVHAGPVFGRKTFAAGGVAAEREARVLAAYGLEPRAFQPFGKLALGTRRANLIYPEGLAVSPHPRGIELSFVLPSGAYATVVMREFVREELR